MESNKAPFHDFAPSWLKLSTSPNDISTCEKPETFETTDEFDLRPQYLKKELNNQENKGIVKTGSNNHLIKDINLKANYLSSRYHLFNYDSNDFRKYSSLNGNGTINPLSNNVNNINNTSNSNNNINSINIDNSINNNRKYSSRLKNGDYLRRPSSRSEFREDGNSFFYPKNHTQYANKPKFNIASENLLGLEEKGSNLNSSKSKSSIKSNSIADSNTFKEEFPSLVDENVINFETSNGNNVWDNVKKKVLSTTSKKVNLLPRAVCFSDSSNHSAENGKSFEESNLNIGSTFYRTLVPVVPKKRSTNGLNRNNGKDSNTLVNSLSNLSLGKNIKILPVFPKSRDHSSSIQSMEILVKKHLKMRRDKNEFLRTLRSSDNSRTETEEEESCEYKDMIKNNSRNVLEQDKIQSDSNKAEKEDKKIKDDDIEGDEIEENGVNMLSSSLEAEERLLREMGWNEEEDDKIYAPLTEAEVNEFKDLIKSSRHDIVKRSINFNQQLQFILSPKKKISPLICLNKAINKDHQIQEENSDSTSDEDDDSDIDA